MANANIDEIAKQFTDFYYNTFDTDRTGLGNLYRDNSMLTWESEQIQGASNILTKLTSLPFQKVQHKITTLDAQPSNPGIASLIVLVTGQLLVDDGAHPMNYSQIFQLIPTEDQKSYFIFNDVFRLVYG
ncbi:nuclear transport factor 2 [Atractiella rhizophila]|nr:nuclear transport factor 2 [Atractiella rhizophila]KAH8925152.1 nuclear transport factor 2 [Atractiella rhizophila]